MNILSSFYFAGAFTLLFLFFTGKLKLNVHIIDHEEGKDYCDPRYMIVVVALLWPLWFVYVMFFQQK